MKNLIAITAISLSFGLSAYASERVYATYLVDLGEKQQDDVEASVLEGRGREGAFKALRNTGAVIGSAGTAAVWASKTKGAVKAARSVSVLGFGASIASQGVLATQDKLVVEENVIRSAITNEDVLEYFNDPLMKMMSDTLDIKFKTLGGDAQDKYPLFDMQFVGSPIPLNLLNSLVANVAVDMEPAENFRYVCDEAYDSLNEEVNHRMKDGERLTTIHKKFAKVYFDDSNARENFVQKCVASFSESLLKEEVFLEESVVGAVGSRVEHSQK